MSEPTPPKLANRFLRWFCAPEFIEEVQGDLEELYDEDLVRHGQRKANRQYWRNVIRHLRPIFLRKASIQLSTQNHTAMWSNYLKIALRNFWKSKVISSINVIGLSLGLASCLIVFFHVKDELSYDQFIENGDDIYRVLNVYPSYDPPYWAGGPIPLGPTLKEEFPGIRDAVRLWQDYDPTLQLGDKVFKESDLIFADSSFFQMFSFDLEVGNPKTVLSEPNTIVFTRDMVNKYFGEEDPMGKTIKYNGGRGQIELKITGIMDNLPHNTHMQFDFLASFLTVKRNQYYWGSFKPIWTYVTLNEGVAPQDIISALPDFAAKYTPDRVKEEEGFTFTLEKMSDIYMKSKAARNMKPLGNLQAIYVFAIVGISILLIACINFVNLSMAKSLSRSKEVGIRKTIGARKWQVVKQFLVESTLTITLSLVVAGIWIALFLPIYNVVTGKEILVKELFKPQFVGPAVTVLLVVCMVAGLYPALFISRAKTVNALKRSTDKAGASLGLRKAFVVFQFLISATLIIGILITQRQMSYITNKSLGVTTENVVAIPYSQNAQVFIDQLEAIPEVISYGISQRLPVNVMNYDGRTFHVEGMDKAVNAQSCVISGDFLETFDIEIIAGRNHFREASDQWEFLINETAVQDYGWNTPENALGKTIFYDPEDTVVGKVIGVFKDYHLESLHEKIPPMLMFRNAYADRWTRWGKDFISIKFQTDEIARLLETIEQKWVEQNPDKAYFNVLLDDSYKQLHEADYRFATIFNYITVIAILIACLGLLGLSMLAVRQRTKEIGIRKALGATVIGVSQLLSRSFLKLVLIGLILAAPVAYYLMENWLNGFSYRISIGIEQFIIAFLLTVLVSMLTIGFQTIRAAMANPAHSLRDE